jgi:hypothetical protein
MAQPIDLSGLSRDELEAQLVSTREELEDVGYERSMTLGGTGVHLGAVEAERLRAEFERDESRLLARVAEIEKALSRV